MPDPSACQHARRKLIARDKDAEYIECLDCGAILEAEELAAAPKPDSAAEPPAFPESLSDA
jgi:hypothetical protein